ncbi:MAG: LapA family protein [Fluviicola sp.]
MKNTVALIISICILILTIIFTLQNTQIVRVYFLFGSREASLSLILFVTLGIGVLCTLMVFLPVVYKLKAHQKKLNGDTPVH